jgi:hypothetical protein
VINPVTGGLATESEIRRDLDYWRRFLLTYRSMDKESGGMPAVAEAVVLLENALKDVDKASTDASYEFLKRNQSIHWNSGVPTWDHWELVDGAEWRITTYEIAVDLINPRPKTHQMENL